MPEKSRHSKEYFRRSKRIVAAWLAIFDHAEEFHSTATGSNPIYKRWITTSDLAKKSNMDIRATNRILTEMQLSGEVVIRKGTKNSEWCLKEVEGYEVAPVGTDFLWKKGSIVSETAKFVFAEDNRVAISFDKVAAPANGES